MARLAYWLATLALGFALGCGLAVITPAMAQQPVNPGYIIENSSSGSTIESFQKTTADQGLPVGAIVVATCGTPPATYDAGRAYSLTMDTTGTLCTAGGSGGGTVDQGSAGTNAQAWWVRIGDATNGPAAVKAASTAPVAADPALVVGISPNSAGIITTGTDAVPSSQVLSVQGTALTTTSTAALAANLVAKAAAGTLWSFQVSATSTLSVADWYVMLFNATSAPADGAVTPVKCWRVPAGATSFTASFDNQITFATGITISVGTTGCFTKTASTQAFISADVK